MWDSGTEGGSATGTAAPARKAGCRSLSTLQRVGPAPERDGSRPARRRPAPRAPRSRRQPARRAAARVPGAPPLRLGQALGEGDRASAVGVRSPMISAPHQIHDTRTRYFDHSVHHAALQPASASEPGTLAGNGCALPVQPPREHLELPCSGSGRHSVHGATMPHARVVVTRTGPSRGGRPARTDAPAHPIGTEAAVIVIMTPSDVTDYGQMVAPPVPRRSRSPQQLLTSARRA